MEQAERKHLLATCVQRVHICNQALAYGLSDATTLRNANNVAQSCHELLLSLTGLQVFVSLQP